MRHFKINRTDTSLSVVIPQPESRRIKHKDLVFSNHWYQLPLIEGKLGVISTVFDKGVYFLLDRYRNQVASVSPKLQRDRLNNVLSGLLSNIYLVEQGKIYKPYLHPTNFVYSTANGRVVTFYRYDEPLLAVDGEYYYDLYKLIAFIFSSVDVKDYNKLTIADIEVLMSEDHYKWYRELIDLGNVVNMLEYLGVYKKGEDNKLDTYSSIIPNSRPATIKEVKFYANWVSKRVEPESEDDGQDGYDSSVYDSTLSKEEDAPKRKVRDGVKPTQNKRNKGDRVVKEDEVSTNRKQVSNANRRPKTKQEPTNKKGNKKESINKKDVRKTRKQDSVKKVDSRVSDDELFMRKSNPKGRVVYEPDMYEVYKGKDNKGLLITIGVIGVIAIVGLLVYAYMTGML